MSIVRHLLLGTSAVSPMANPMLAKMAPVMKSALPKIAKLAGTHLLHHSSHVAGKQLKVIILLHKTVYNVCLACTVIQHM